MAADAGAFRIDTDGDDVTLWFQPNSAEEPTVLTMRASVLRVALASVGLDQPPVFGAGRGSASFVGVGAGRGGRAGTTSTARDGFPGGGGVAGLSCY